MKLRVNYDLMEKIRESKKGYKIQKYFIPGFFGNLIGGCISIPIIYHGTNDNIASTITFVATSTIVINFIISKVACNINQTIAKTIAEIDLQKLANQLVTLEVKTSAKLLKEAKIIQEYTKIEFVDQKIKSKKLRQYLNRDNIRVPKLKEYKYIEVLQTNEHKQTLLQEHIFGDKDYELSVEEPETQEQLKLARVFG